MRVTLMPSGFSRRTRYRAVASPSTVGLVATMISVVLCRWMRGSSSLIFSISGMMPSCGDMTPWRTW